MWGNWRVVHKSLRTLWTITEELWAAIRRHILRIAFAPQSELSTNCWINTLLWVNKPGSREGFPRYLFLPVWQIFVFNRNFQSCFWFKSKTWLSRKANQLLAKHQKEPQRKTQDQNAQKKRFHCSRFHALSNRIRSSWQSESLWKLTKLTATLKLPCETFPLMFQTSLKLRWRKETQVAMLLYKDWWSVFRSDSPRALLNLLLKRNLSRICNKRALWSCTKNAGVDLLLVRKTHKAVGRPTQIHAGYLVNNRYTGQRCWRHFSVSLIDIRFFMHSLFRIAHGFPGLARRNAKTCI